MKVILGGASDSFLPALSQRACHQSKLVGQGDLMEVVGSHFSFKGLACSQVYTAYTKATVAIVATFIKDYIPSSLDFVN